MLQRRRISRIFFRRSFFDYPLSLKPKLALQLGPINSVQIGLSYLKSRFFPLQDETFLRIPSLIGLANVCTGPSLRNIQKKRV